MRITAIDFETTGKNTDDVKHAVCEVGWCNIDGDDDFPWVHGMPTSLLVNPNRPMPPEAAGVHGIEDSDLVGAPPITTGFMRIVEQKADYYAAHNAEFEQAFFGGGETPWLDTYKIALRLWPDAPDHKQGTLRHMLKLDVDRAAAFPPHRAGPDAYVCAALLVRILEVATVDIPTMVRWSAGPALLPRCPLKKHRGQLWTDVPSGYLRWMCEQPDMERDLKANAKHHLKLRGETV